MMIVHSSGIRAPTSWITLKSGASRLNHRSSRSTLAMRGSLS